MKPTTTGPKYSPTGARNPWRKLSRNWMRPKTFPWTCCAAIFSSTAKPMRRADPPATGAELLLLPGGAEAALGMKFASPFCPAEHASRECGERAGKQEPPPVECRGLLHRQGIGYQARQQRHGEARDHDAERAAEERQHQALGGQLADQPLASGADRRPDGQLFLAH